MINDPIKADVFEKHSLDKGRPRDFTVDQTLTIDVECFTFRELDVISGESDQTTKETAETLLENAIHEEYGKFLIRRQKASEDAAKSLLGSLSPELAAKVAKELGMDEAEIPADKRSTGKIKELTEKLKESKSKKDLKKEPEKATAKK